MGSVYEAEHTGTGERVAVKLIKTEERRSDEEASARFRREARAASAIDSPHIVRIVDSGTDEATGNLYIVMELLAGEDLQTLVEHAGPLPPGVVLRIAGQALLGLQKAHEKGIVHRDVKPANLFLARRGRGDVKVVIVDFGIAKIRADPSIFPQAASLTTTGGFLGSPLYMSPEQVQDSKDVDHRTDIWSLGTAMYCALTGRAPHQDIGVPGKLIVTICGTPAQRLEERAPWVAPEIAEVVHRALAIDPAKRWPSAAAMLEAIRGLVPDGFALREEMLVGVGPEQRASVSPLAATDPVSPTADAAAGDTVPDETAAGEQEAPRPGSASAPRPAWGRWPRAAGAVLALGVGVAGAYRLFQGPAPIPAPAASTTASMALPTASQQTAPSASASAATAEGIVRGTSVASAAPEADGARADRDGGVAALDGSGTAHAVHAVKPRPEVADGVERPHEAVPTPRSTVLATPPPAAASGTSAPGTAPPAAPPPHKAEDSLMPPLPP